MAPKKEQKKENAAPLTPEAPASEEATKATDTPSEADVKDQIPTGGAEGAPEPSQEEFEAFLKECMTAVAERDEFKDKYMRLAAEYDNYRKRTQRERDSIYMDAQAATLEKLLPVYDNLERALAQRTDDAAYYKGVELIMKGLMDTFEKMDVHRIEAQDQPFDPALHDAMMHIEDDSGEESMVAEVFQTGFIMGDRVVRHAKVKVKN